jgi:hypothetical protein
VIEAAAFDQERLETGRIGDGVFLADDRREARQQLWRRRAAKLFIHLMTVSGPRRA